MEKIGEEKQGKKKVTREITFSVPFNLDEIKENFTINTNTTSNISKDVLNQAFNAHTNGNIKEAIESYQYLISQGFNDPRVYLNYGSILKNLGKLEEAELIIRKGIELNPNFAMGYFNLGIILIDLSKPNEAELATREGIKLNPNFAIGYFNLGIILKTLGKMNEAVLAINKAIELNPNHSNSYFHLGTILNILGQKKEAEIEIKKAIKINPNFLEAYINLGIILRDLGKIKEAILVTRRAIEVDPNIAESYSNLGSLLVDLGNLDEAEKVLFKAINLNPNLAKSYNSLGILFKTSGKILEAEKFLRQAINLEPDFPESYYNLGTLMRDIGKLKEAEDLLVKSIQIDPYIAKSYFVLSTLKSTSKDKIWKDKLFSESILTNLLSNNRFDIFFARANILHREKNYIESAKYLKLANSLKFKNQQNYSNNIILKTKMLLIDSENSICSYNQNISRKAITQESIFIVGMFRSGSTLLESIISMNPNVVDLGETNILEESYEQLKKYNENNQDFNLSNLYYEKVNHLKYNSKISTNKALFNYQYSGIIAKQILNSKIIHCFRNPLDNILSIYRANFAHKNEYASSLIECTKIYLDQDHIMELYKKKYREKIYDLNYDLLVSNPKEEIKSLISWMGWEWNDLYLSPHLNKRSISTASSVQVRFPINSKSIGGWKNYKDILRPAIEILKKTYKYRNIIS
ncbi:tetratricopeptide repeat protein [Prochlorococcus sp. MIT 0801]|uniref:tetratricopeptide repeat-containing sulfotransferase family protein n=1 Tax=Prochlorococcus sp. MIT 0801 TaxID=1501269 RepID=UPI0004F6B1D7|nr:tetratricopeptide repeat protein [Prochlorococcus sp. MIT 0801]AIQ96637.1 Translation elongation factor P [Prochlorococcus sp. MIT 0801]